MVEKDYNFVHCEYFSPESNGNDNLANNIEEKPKNTQIILDISKFQSGSSFA